MLRKLVLMLILGNLLLWAWSHGALRAFGWAPAATGEPQRLAQQLHPDALQLLDPQGQVLPPLPAASPPGAASAAASGASAPASAASAASKAGSEAGSAATRQATEAASSASSAAGPTAATGPASCLRFGPFDSDPDPRVGDALRAAGFAPKAEQQALPEQWMVLMGPYPDSATLQRKLGELRRLSLPADSFIPVSGRPRYMPGISLGVFARREQAQAQLEHLQAHGVQTAHLVQRNLGLQARWWVLPQLDDRQVRSLRTLPALQALKLRAQDCPAP